MVGLGCLTEKNPLQPMMIISTSKALLPVRASEQGNVIGLVSVYIYVYKKKL